MSFRIIGSGAYLPERVILNSQLPASDINNEWVISRTGIKQRHFASESQTPSDMAYIASINAINEACIDKNTIDLIILATTTPDNTFPSVATKLHKMLALNNQIPAFDIQAVCAGFIYAIHLAQSLMKSNNYNRVLLVAAEKMSNILDMKDRSTSILFGDGAASLILQKDESGFVDSIVFSEGNCDILYTNGGVGSTKDSGKIIMNGKEVFKHAVQKMQDVSKEILLRNNLNVSDIDYFIPHQANSRIIDTIVKNFGIDEVKVIKTIDMHANCSAASIPLAICYSKNKFKQGDIILSTALGAGLSWGAAVFKW